MNNNLIELYLYAIEQGFKYQLLWMYQIENCYSGYRYRENIRDIFQIMDVNIKM